MGFVYFDALFRARFSFFKYHFAYFWKNRPLEIIFRWPFRVLTPVAIRVYDEHRDGFLHQRIRHPAQRERASGLFRLRSGESPRPAERRGAA
jgi:hypothetical protein